MAKPSPAAAAQAKLEKAEGAATTARAKAELASAKAEVVRAEIVTSGMRLEYDFESGTRKVVTISGAGRRRGGIRK